MRRPIQTIADEVSFYKDASKSVALLPNTTAQQVVVYKKVLEMQIPVLANDVGDALKLVDATGATHGDLIITEDGLLVYRPHDCYFTGKEHIQYTVEDAHGEHAQGSLTLNLLPYPHSPLEAVNTGLLVESNVPLHTPMILEPSTPLNIESLLYPDFGIFS